ncbi:MAG TPA: AAA family ATPase [Burkholderiales bacterium]|nr:AAA family ATPase [Burkholderiales bacterium]
MSPFIAALLRPSAFPHPVSNLSLVETHISWVLLTGDYAYKVKKPVNLGFLDFSTLERRHFFCAEELRLNRRLAPELYLDVVPVTGSADAPRIAGTGTAIEYAVRMRQFEEAARLDRVLARGALDCALVDKLARRIAGFHAALPPAAPAATFGSAENIGFYARQNFDQIRPRLAQTSDLDLLARLEAWSSREFVALGEAFAARRRGGFVRECHGDLHLANIALIAGEPVVFDCIDFNPELRWIDVASEVAFVVMDLEDRGRPDLGNRFLNAYLENCGDYPGLAVLRFYRVYRALVRAKVAAFRLGQPELPERERAGAATECGEYLRLALRFTQPPRPWLAITRGVSGSGKTTLTLPAVEALGAIRIRSDVERKRLFGLAAEARSGSALDQGLYGRAAGERTYARLEELAESALRAGFGVIADATFLEQPRRQAFRELAARCGVPFAILDFHAPDDLLQGRVAAREKAATDASEAGVAVLRRQRQSMEALTAEEQALAIAIDSGRPDAAALVIAGLKAVC